MDNMHAQQAHMVLVPMAWESHSSPRMGDRPQEIINEQLLDKCDLLVAIFWTRLGTATGEAASGTVEEINRHVSTGKTAMVYFSDKPASPASINQEQYAAVTAFRRECQGNGLFHEFSSLERFREDFRRHLAITIRDDFSQENSSDQLNVSVPTPRPIDLSNEAKELLLEGAKDRNNQIMWLSMGEGLQIQTNGKTFVDMQNVRSEAKWRAAVQQLERNDLIERQSDSIYSVTDQGYEMADSLNIMSTK